MLLLLGARIHIALVDLAYAVAPGLISGATSDRKVRPWLGLVVVALLLLGAFSVGEGAAWIIGQAVPHREQRP